MGWHYIGYYIRHDLLYYRGRREVIFGFISIWFATATLLILFALASTVESIVDRSLEEARPMMGTLRVQSLNSATLTNDQQTFLKTLATTGRDVENLSWIAEDFTYGFDIWPAQGTETEQKKLLLKVINATLS